MSNNHGGARSGAGRRKGSQAVKTLRRLGVADAVLADGIAPLEVMLRTMRTLWAIGTPEAQKEACTVARDCAPYLHPRLAATTITGDGEGLVIRIVRFAEPDEVKMIDGKADAVH